MSLSSSSKHKTSNSCSADLKLFIKDISDQYGKKRPLFVRTWSTVKDVKDAISKLLLIPPSAQRLYFSCNGSNILMSASLGKELPNHRTLSDAGIYRNGETILLEVKDNEGLLSSSSIARVGENDVCVSPALMDLAPRSILRLILLAKRGFARGIKPELVMDGTGGTYFLHDSKKVKVAVFKPEDEEPYAENNPRGYITTISSRGRQNETSMRAGIKPGEACLREVAAYLLDHDGFSGVPATTLAEARHPNFHVNGSLLKVAEGGASIGPHSLCFMDSSHTDPSQLSARVVTKSEQRKKVGSFQQYIPSECTMDDLSPSKLSVDEVHKIAILDIRLLNADRNPANLLVVRKFNEEKGNEELSLVPIDHGYCLRTVADVSWFDWCWLEWSQLKQPLSQKTRDYVLNRINIEEDLSLLRDRLHIPTLSLDYFRTSTKLLQEGVRAGMTLYDIAILCCRNDDLGEVPSKLERLTMMASEIASSAVNNNRWDDVTLKSPFSQLTRRHTHNSRCYDNKDTSSNLQSVLSPLVKSSSNINFRFLNIESNEFEQSKHSVSVWTSSDSSTLVPPSAPLAPSSDSGSSDSEDRNDDKFGASVIVSNNSTLQPHIEEWASSFVVDFVTGSGTTEMKTSSSKYNPFLITSFNRSEAGDDDSSNLSTSPVGFWTFPPSARKVQKKSEEVDVVWTPHASPLVKPEATNNASKENFSSDKVAFESCKRVSFDCPPPVVLAPSFLGSQSKTTTHSYPLKRSQSYSALTFRSSGFKDGDESCLKNGLAKFNTQQLITSLENKETNGAFRDYYVKFIDLLIARLAAAEHTRIQKVSIRNKVENNEEYIINEKANPRPRLDSVSFCWSDYDEKEESYHPSSKADSLSVFRA